MLWAPFSFWNLQRVLQENVLFIVKSLNIIHIDKYSMKGLKVYRQQHGEGTLLGEFRPRHPRQHFRTLEWSQAHVAEFGSLVTEL